MKDQSQQPQRGDISVVVRSKASKLRQERHISPLTGPEIFVGSLSTKIPLLNGAGILGRSAGKTGDGGDNLGTLTHPARAANRVQTEMEEMSIVPHAILRRILAFRRHPVVAALAYLEGLAFQIASVSAEPCERTPLSVRISSVAANICARGKIIVSP